jgi:hypothetical protein
MDKLGVKNTPNQENENWLKKVERKSKSKRTRIVANTSLKTFDMFCESMGIEKHSDPGLTKTVKLVRLL